MSEYDHFKQPSHVVGRQRLFGPLDINYLLKQALRKWLGEEIVVAYLSLLRF